ncbi:hypothetical protein OIK44_18415 [Janthinobacterium sp. hw3]|uniref:YcgL domain-containing protein n=2 Tax=Janthinobacterium fluminis TaxID=2987524 RepID=A0ABT5K478_9BURK|nr:hypothetical protein [Janthinobacterium fluminis]
MEPFTYLIQQKQGDGFMVFRLDSRTGECDIECMPEKILAEMSFKESPPRTLGEFVDNLPAWGAEAEGIQFRSPSDVATPLTVPALSEGMAQ